MFFLDISSFVLKVALLLSDIIRWFRVCLCVFIQSL